MQQQRDNCSGKSVKPQEKRGLECKPLFDAIPVKNYLAPVLHSVDLFINTAKDLLDAFIDHRIEDRPQELLEARWLEAEMKIAERQALEEFDDTKAIVEEVTTSGADEDLIQKSKAVQALAEEAHKAAKKAYGKAAAAARKLEKSKSYGAMTQAIRQEVDGLLADTFHILRSSYHGGDMEGNHCRRLVRLADKAMEAIQALLLSVPRNQRALGCTDNEIIKYCTAYKRLFQYFDLLSSYCYQPYGSIVDSEMANVRKLGKLLDNLFRKLSRNVPPKVHVWQHLIEDLERLRGMKYHQESKIEAAHQHGVKADMRFRAMAGSIEKKMTASLKYQANMTDPATRAKQEEVSLARRRKLGDKAKAGRNDRDDNTKRQKETHKEEVLALPENKDELPTMLELAVIDQLQRSDGA